MLFRQTLNFSEVQFKGDGQKGTFEGYAARFGQTTQDGSAVLMQGCFAYTLRKFGKPKMFFAHNWDMPIGRYTKAAEDDSGLYVAGEFTPGLQLAQDVRAAMLHETLDGLSIGGTINRADMTADPENEDRVIINRWTRLIEVSPVVFPNLDGARVTSVHSESIDDALEGVDTIRDFERFLRDAGGLSKALATALSSRARTIFSEQGEPATRKGDAAKRNLIERIERISAGLDV